MKILFILENTIKDLQGGTEVSSYHLASLLCRSRDKVEEWTPYGSRKPIFWYTSVIGQIYILIVLVWKLVKDRVDILHVQGKYLVPSAVLAGKLLRIPTVVTIRDYIVVCPVGFCLFDIWKGSPLQKQGRTLGDSSHGFRWFLKNEIPAFSNRYHQGDRGIIRGIRWAFLIRGWLVTKWLRWWLKKADSIIAVSKAVQEILKQHDIKSTVIHNSFDSNAGEVSDTSLSEVSETVLFVGKTSYGKGYDLFGSLSRFPSAPSSGAKRGVNNKEWGKYQFKTIGGKAKLPYSTVLQEMREAFVVVVPSRWPEPFGRVALESIMMGTPVVASRRGGLPEIVEDGVTGVIVEPTVRGLKSGLIRVIRDNRKLRKNIRNRRLRLEQKFREIPREKHVSLYDSLVKS